VTLSENLSALVPQAQALEAQVAAAQTDLADLMARETALYAKIIKTSGIQPE
jgi:cell division protein FtsB